MKGRPGSDVQVMFNWYTKLGACIRKPITCTPAHTPAHKHHTHAHTLNTHAHTLNTHAHTTHLHIHATKRAPHAHHATATAAQFPERHERIEPARVHSESTNCTSWRSDGSSSCLMSRHPSGFTPTVHWGPYAWRPWVSHKTHTRHNEYMARSRDSQHGSGAHTDPRQT